MINRGGPSLIVRIADQTGAAAAAIAAAFAAVRDSFGLTALNAEIDALDDKISGQAAARALRGRAGPAARPPGLVPAQRRSRRRVSRRSSGTIAKASRRSRRRSTKLCRNRRGARDARVTELAKAGVPEALARRIASLPVLKAAPDIVLVADRAEKPVAEVAATYFATEAFFQLDRVTSAVPNIVVSDYFDRLALDRALDSIGDAERRLAAAMVGNGARRRRRRRRMGRAAQAEVERIRSAIHEIAGSGLTLSKLTVAASLLGDLAKD